MHYQIFVKGLDGTTKCLQISSSRLEIKTLKEKLSDLLRIPPEFQRLVSGTRQIADEGFVFAEPDGFFPQINVLLRLRAGKGGFGSLLRGAATKAGQKKTNNNDACRDMSGRRLRHVNAEKKLEEWKAEAEERQLEKIAEAYLKKQMKMKKKTDPNLDEGARDVEKYRVEASRAVDMVESAVKDGLLEALKLQRNGKRKMEEDVKVSVKRHKLWMLEEEDEDKDSDEEIEDAKHDEHLMKGNEECGSSHTSNSESASDSGIPSPSEIGSPGSGSCDDREGNVNLQKKKLESLGDNGNCWDGRETNTELEKEMLVTSIPFEMKNMIHANMLHNSEANVDVKTEEPNSSYGENDTGSGEQKASIDINKEVPVASNIVDGQHIIISHNMDEIEINSNIAGLTSQIPDSDRTSSDVNCGSESIITNATVEINSVCDSNSNIGEPLNFDTFNTAKDMEVLGLERLKNELQSCGLKCGGSLSERAARLFLLKTIPLEKLPKKHFAKSNEVGK